MNNESAEVPSDFKRRSSYSNKFRSWWQDESRYRKTGLRSGGIVALFVLAGCLAFGGLLVQNSQAATAASVIHATTDSASILNNSEKAKCPAVNNNPWCYNFTHGPLIYRPQSAFCRYFNCVSDFWKATHGYVVECWNGKYSHSGGVRGVCSRDKKVRRTLYS